jgi:antitoxin VapB
MLTRVFKSGNSLAVRIPKELGFDTSAQDVEIERQGETLVIRPLQRRKLAGLGAKFAAFSPDFMAEGREMQEQKARDWD